MDDDYYLAIGDFFHRYRGIWFSFYGKIFDHLLLNNILTRYSERRRVIRPTIFGRKEQVYEEFYGLILSY
jgi:hypothetical protein